MQGMNFLILRGQEACRYRREAEAEVMMEAAVWKPGSRASASSTLLKMNSFLEDQEEAKLVVETGMETSVWMAYVKAVGTPVSSICQSELKRKTFV